MSTLGEKIRILRTNNEMTDLQLGELLGFSDSTVQKWEVGKSTPSIETIKKLCEIFYVPVEKLLDDNVDLPEYFEIDRYLPYEDALLPEELQDSDHVILDADLAREGRLHRFTNASGIACSAIYIGHKRIWWHYREHEARMIRDWNREYGNDR